MSTDHGSLTRDGKGTLPGLLAPHTHRLCPTLALGVPTSQYGGWEEPAHTELRTPVTQYKTPSLFIARVPRAPCCSLSK